MRPPDESPVPDRDVEPSRAIVEAVAEREGVDVTEIEPPAYDPLYAVVNPEALDRLVGSPDAPGVHVRFEYEGYDVVVSPDGRVWVSDPGDPSERRIGE
ncbi:HalOD1 output domain-containing protein [Natrarchaeobaculum aegyptiacum]|uniref:Halobacterial output domain-containing protein n=1 Tax=Natrarchaeobaculum aegyptiacum TaxID=745377 RepID=A0A2Z2HXX2_9EURY|nr:HalOD1 output domain-containing protein [Natrarchaeobaculum aegyptiacum]ARS88308.1 hypothetical protein B1756_00055 [Natrarchaeobaculum aegyptiacum]